MSAVYHGYTNYTCYDDCIQAGCPGHDIRLVSKHGSYYVEFVKGPNHEVTDRIDLPGGIGLINAVRKILNHESI